MNFEKIRNFRPQVQLKTPRMRFVSLEIVLITIFLVGYSLIDYVFLDGYTRVSALLDPTAYMIYMICMLFLFLDMALVFIFLGMWIQRWVFERQMKKEITKIMDVMPNVSFTKILEKEQ